MIIKRDEHTFWRFSDREEKPFFFDPTTWPRMSLGFNVVFLRRECLWPVRAYLCEHEYVSFVLFENLMWFRRFITWGCIVRGKGVGSDPISRDKSSGNVSPLRSPVSYNNNNKPFHARELYVYTQDLSRVLLLIFRTRSGAQAR